MVPLLHYYMLHNFPLCPMTHHFLLGILLAFTLVLLGREEGGRGMREKRREIIQMQINTGLQHYIPTDSAELHKSALCATLKRA